MKPTLFPHYQSASDIDQTILKQTFMARYQFLTIREAHQMLRISKSKLYDMLRAGKIKAYKIGSRTIIPLQSIEAYQLEEWKASFK
ncbi:MAG TPA: helix-turn-helix domain-containing protein [Candidatus Saccharimonadales bacterium]|nr:helix-turn-helix domain-containing protein [Candidatus Saccharimonadales bacterium]